MRTTYISNWTRLKVGLFTLAGLALVILFSVVVNNRPYWWRPCQLVNINVEDATGLKSKSPVRSLGIDIGYLQSVGLRETHVNLGICITAPVEVLTETRAYIRGEGFLGDKFVELKPVKYVGPIPAQAPDAGSKTTSFSIGSGVSSLLKSLSPISSAHAQVAVKKAKVSKNREIPVEQETQDIEHVVNRVDDLVNEVTDLANNLKEAINPDELRKTMRQLNTTLENASRTLAPEGGLTQTAQRTLAKLEDAVEQLRDQAVRINKGEGSLGMLLNDPAYAHELHEAIRNINRLLNRVADVQFIVDMGAVQLPAYNGGRAWFQVGIWPRPERYYLLGIAIDPRGRISNQTITTIAGGQTQTIQTLVVDQTNILLTAMMGKVFFKRFDIAVGALYGDGAGSFGLLLGSSGKEDRLVLRNDLYIRTAGSSLDDRLSLTFQPFPNFFLRAGLESMYRHPINDRIVYYYGVGISFNDEDIKLLFALK